MYLVSVVVPVYNSKDTIEMCIESIINQSFGDFEIIIIDDGSMDGSAEICDCLADKYQNVFVYHQENKGLACARQAGVERSTSEYILFVDSDDWIERNMLKYLSDYAIKNDADIVCSSFFYDYPNGFSRKKHKGRRVIVCKDKFESSYQLHATRRISPTACAKLIRRVLLEQINYPQNLAIGEEHDMIEQLLTLSKTVVVSSEAFYHYVQHKSGISHSGYNPKYKNSLNNYINLRKALAGEFPNIANHISVFFIEYELAIITAMCRNGVFDEDDIAKIQLEIRNNIFWILLSLRTCIHYKICMIMIAIWPQLFIFCFTIIHRICGR